MLAQRLVRGLGGAGAAAFFTRLERPEALDNPRRQLILAFVERHPGVRFHQLKQELEIPHGTLVHHLRILRQQGLLVLEREGRRLRVRLPGQRVEPSLAPELVPLATLVRQEPGLTVAEAATRLGWPRWTTRYRARRLRQTGVLQFEGGRRPRRLIPGPVAEALAAPGTP